MSKHRQATAIPRPSGPAYVSRRWSQEIIFDHRNRAAELLSEEDEDPELEHSTGSSEDSSDSATVRRSRLMPAPRVPFFSRVKQLFARGRTTSEEQKKLVSHTPLKPRPNERQLQRASNITVPTELLLRALCAKLGVSHCAIEGGRQDESHVDELSALLRMQLRHDLQESSLWLLDAFDLLSGDSGCQPAGEAGGELDRDSRDQQLSDRFIDLLCELMQRAHFRLLSQREWQFAQAENFMFTLPTAVEWERLDSAMISRLFVRHPHLGLQAAQLSRRVLIFHRGSAVELKTSWFLEEKLDMLLDRIVTDPCRRCYWALCRVLPWGLRAESRADISGRGEPPSTVVPRLYEGETSSLGLRTTQRVNLDRLLPSLGRLCWRFFRQLTVQEPSFEEVVVAYAEIADKGHARPNEPEGAPQLRLKSFRDIPVADVEVSPVLLWRGQFRRRRRLSIALRARPSRTARTLQCMQCPASHAPLAFSSLVLSACAPTDASAVLACSRRRDRCARAFADATAARACSCRCERCACMLHRSSSPASASSASSRPRPLSSPPSCSPVSRRRSTATSSPTTRAGAARG